MSIDTLPIDSHVALIVIAITLLLCLSAFFSGSETALTAVSRARMHALQRDGHKGAGTVSRLLEKPERIIGTVLLGNNLVNILASALTTSLMIELFGEAGVLYATIILTTFIVIFCEVLPKTYAIAYSDRFALVVAPVMSLLISAFRPLTSVVEWIVTQLMRLTPQSADDDANILAHHELRGTIELSSREGVVDYSDAKRLGGVLNLRDLELDDLMQHRTEMDTINGNDPPDKIVADVLRSAHTRIPVWRDEPDNIVGILHSKDLLAELGRNGWDVNKLDIGKLAIEPWFVPDTTSVPDQLSAFLQRKTQLAMVVDEYGEVQGLITLEDILEEIVGEIIDEHDIGEEVIRRQPDGAVNVDGGVAIRDVNREMDWNLPDEEAVTIAGLVIHEAQTIPEPGQTFTFHGYRFEILRRSKNRITAIRVRRLDPDTGLPEAPDQPGSRT
ncbi:MAG: HlyC/CorC family transporter [Alphaproteobacteria bacterium]|nr:HlyC/CorC family transporter [Alphaproteobacteria bacterium]